MKRITIGCGIQYDKAGRILTQPRQTAARAVIVQRAVDWFGGVTILDTYGAWKDAVGKVVIEKGWSIVVYAGEYPADQPAVADNFAAFVRDTLNQQAVFLIVEEVDATLV